MDPRRYSPPPHWENLQPAIPHNQFPFHHPNSVANLAMPSFYPQGGPFSLPPWQLQGGPPYVPDLTNAGPKQSRKPPTSQAEAISSNTPRFSAHALLNPTSAAGRSAMTGGANPMQMATPQSTVDYKVSPLEQPGMSSMIERMHNVENRDGRAPAKRKVETRTAEEEDPDRKKAKFDFGGASNGGTMSQHLKLEREKIAAQSGPAALVDLTNDQEEDDCQIVGSTNNSKEEVCLGVITTYKANISRLPYYSRNAQAGVGKESWPRTKLDPRRPPGAGSSNHRMELVDRSGKMCGTLDVMLAAHLCPLFDTRHTNNIRMAFYLDTHRRKNGDIPGSSVSLSVGVTVLMYAPRAAVKQIGTYLSQRQVFLTSPMAAGLPVGKEIVNPHDLGHLGKSVPAPPGQRRPQTAQPVQSISRSMEEMKRDAEGMFDSLVKHEDLPEMEVNAKLITTELMPHQKQALYFMSDHEKADHSAADRGGPGFSLWKARIDSKKAEVWYNVISGHESRTKPKPTRGGILADMMGLGKTLSILSLIASTREEARAYGDAEPTDDDVDRNAKTTLIICPKSVMSNWHEQIRAHTRPNQFKVYSYHGSSRMQDVDQLAKHNIILTTYSTAAAEFSTKNRALGSISWFRIVLDEAHQIRNQTTQVSKACCALAAQRRWAVTGTPVQNGLGDLGALIKFLQVKPFDEDRNWAQFIMAPFKNANVDVIQHLRLLVDSITLRRMKDKIDLPDRHEKIERLDWSVEDRRIYERVSGESSKKLMMMSNSQGLLKGKAYAHVLKSILRMRMLCAHSLDMFSEDDRKEIAEGMDPENAIAIDLGDEPDLETYDFVTENEAYSMLQMSSDSDTNRCAKCDRKVGEPENVEVIDSGSEAGNDSSDEESSGEGAGDDTIGYLTPCYHLLCSKCKDTYVRDAQQDMTADQRHHCPCCEAYVRFGLFPYQKSSFSQFLAARTAKIKGRKGKGRRFDESTYKGPFTKVQALVEDLKKSAMQTAQLPEGESPIRSVVFSGWTNYLDLIEVALEDNELGFVRLDGTMSVKARTSVLNTFKTDPTITVLLISIKAGGQGLNLTSASKAYMMEPQFNPGVEQQAIDRVHRLGQKRDVFITHYIMKDSVENGILELQKKKENLARFTLERKLSKQDEAKKRIEELRSLFK